MLDNVLSAANYTNTGVETAVMYACRTTVGMRWRE